MQYLLDNPEKATLMGQAAEYRYWKLFTADKMVDEYIKLYQSLL
jgi:rhamnosyl/mannosyltransferase